MLNLLLLAATLLGQPAPASAEKPDPPPPEWRISFQPYLWALSNQVRIATQDYDRSDFTPYLDALLNQYQYGFLWTTQAIKGKLGWYMDGHFVRLKDDGRELGLPYRSDVRQMLFEGALIYRLGDAMNHLDFLIGARYFRMKSEVEVRLVGDFNDLFAWFEPMLGLHTSLTPKRHPRWRIETAADIGGFELGSDLTWQASAAIRYQITPRRSISLGYRHLDLEYHDGPRRYESEMSGPILGFGFHF
jgi:hypothetical protein